MLDFTVHAAPAEPTNPRIGAGILLGEPTGFSLELELDRNHALDAVSYSLVEGALHLHTDYLFGSTGMPARTTSVCLCPIWVLARRWRWVRRMIRV